MEKSTKSIGGLLLAVLAGIALAPMALTLNGWAVATLWGWFIVPQFGLPPLTIPYAIGLCIVVTLIRFKPVKSNPDSQGGYAEITAIFAAPLMSLALGWIVKSFI